MQSVNPKPAEAIFRVHRVALGSTPEVMTRMRARKRQRREIGT